MIIIHLIGCIGRLLSDPDSGAMSGIGNSVLGMATAQAKLGHTVKVVGFSDPYPAGRNYWEGIEIITLSRWKFARIGGVDFGFIIPLILSLIQVFFINIIHIHQDVGLLHLPFGKRKILHLHGHPNGARAGVQRLIQKADCIIACSHYVKKTFLRDFSYPEDRIFVVYNGAEKIEESTAARNEIRDPSNPDKTNLLFVGALVKDKGVDILLDAMGYLNGEDYRGIIIGDSGLWVGREHGDDYENKLHEHAKDLDVMFMGALPHKDTLRIYPLVDMLILPSIVQESNPLVVLEAMAYGLPVIASNVGGVPEIISDQVDGLLIPSHDPVKLSEAILHLTDPLARVKMGSQAFMKAQSFSWNQTAINLLTIYSGLLNR